MYSYVNPMFYEESPTKGQEISKPIFLGTPLPKCDQYFLKALYIFKSSNV